MLKGSQGELKGWDSSQRPSVRHSVRQSTLSNMSIPKTSEPIFFKFYLKHHRVGGTAALGFVLFVCFDALRPSKQLWSCRDVTSNFMGLLPGIEMK